MFRPAPPQAPIVGSKAKDFFLCADVIRNIGWHQFHHVNVKSQSDTIISTWNLAWDIFFLYSLIPA